MDAGEHPKVLVVDDDSMIRAFYELCLAEQYEVHSAGSGEEALEVGKMIMPDLILLDVEMGGMNGYETCRKLREFTSAPIVFATALTTLEEHLKAFDAGGDDVMTKPLVPEILLRKVALAINTKHTQQKLAEEKALLQTMATNMVSTMGESGVLMNFVRANLTCRSYQELAQKLSAAIRDFGLEGSLVLRNGNENTYWATHGEPTSLEVSILEQAGKMGEIFQFKRNLAVNYDQVCIVISNMPEEESERSGRIRENLAILAETTVAFCENVEMRKTSMARAENMQIALFEATKTIESLRDQQLQLLMDVRLLLDGLTDKIERSYSWLNTTNEQERAISSSMNESVQQILDVLAIGNQMSGQFASVVNILRGNDKQSEVDLF